MLKNLLTAGITLLSEFIAPALAYFKGRTDAANKILKDTNERLANRPRTDSDVINQLRSWSKQLKRKGK